MDKKLLVQAVSKFIVGVAFTALLVFVPAGTLAFANGWQFMAVVFVPMLAAGIVLLFNKPELLRKRLNHREKQKEQGCVVALSGIMFIAGFVLAGLNFRFD